jgi:hypothetical protein
MKAGTLFYRVITRKLQGTGGGLQFILLGGFDSKLTTATSSYYETLSPGHVLKQSEIETKVASMQKHGNAADARDMTDAGVAKKLAKLWDAGASPSEAPAGLQTFSGMRIGQYL